MKKGSKIFISFIIIISLIGIYQIYSIKKIKDVIINYETRSGDKELRSSIKENILQICNLNIYKPKVAFVYHDIGNKNYKNNSLEIGFYDVSRNNPFSTNWQTEYTGGTTIQNTTFPELVKMVKEDCSQFQKAKGDFHDKTINWSYSPYTPKPPKSPEFEETEQTEEELEKERQEILEIMKFEEELRKGI